jgi:hypothetical protein
MAHIPTAAEGRRLKAGTKMNLPPQKICRRMRQLARAAAIVLSANRLDDIRIVFDGQRLS